MSKPVRIYLPATLATVAALRERGDVGASSAYAVTSELRAQAGEGDWEEWEYEAFQQAARASLGLVAADPEVPRRRVVIAADAVVEPAQGAEVRLSAPVPLSAVAAIHVDDARAEPAVTKAVTTGAGDLDDELGWYDVSELDQLLS